MKRFFRFALILVSMFSFAGIAYSSTVPNTDHPTTFVGPTLKARLINRLVEDKAYSLAAEAGPKNLRVSGTYAWKFNECQRLKITAEYLWQEITYAFFSGNSDVWVNQIAGGIDWQMDLANNFLYPQLDISAYFSHAPSKSLGTTLGTFTAPQGLPFGFTNERRVAGSNAKGVSPSLTITPWKGSRVTATLNYDLVDYNTKYRNDEDTSGFGGTLGFKQIIGKYLALGLTAAIRQPFNNYDVNLIFSRLPFLGTWTLGLFGDYVAGKNALPNTYNVGLTADFYLDQTREDCTYRGRGRYSSYVDDKMLAFAAVPAVYMPQVLAIADNLTSCTLPVQYLGTPNINPGLPLTNAAFDFAFAPLFSGASIVYSLAVTAANGGAPSDFSINPNTGLLSYAGGAGTYNLTITGSNACSAASVSFAYDNLV